MVRARMVDVPALAWVVGYGTARDPLGHPWGLVVAAWAWPVWVMVLTALVAARAFRPRVPATYARACRLAVVW